jgi:hypothetical protein
MVDDSIAAPAISPPLFSFPSVPPSLSSQDLHLSPEVETKPQDGHCQHQDGPVR